MICLRWPRGRHNPLSVEIHCKSQCTIWISYEEPKEKPCYCNNHDWTETVKLPWSLKSPVKTRKKTPNCQTLHLSQVLFYYSVLSVFPWLFHGGEVPLKVMLLELLLTPCSANVWLCFSAAFPGILQNYLWFQPLLKSVAKCQSSLSKTRNSKAIIFQPGTPFHLV